MRVRAFSATVLSLCAAGCSEDEPLVTPDVADTDIETSDTEEPPAPPPWAHIGPITQGAPLPDAEVLFIERTPDAFPEGLVPEARAMVADLDGDGRDEIIALGTTENLFPRVFRNLTPKGSSDWHFEDMTEASGLDKSMSLLVFGDLDNDGDLDAFSGTSFRSGPEGAHGIWLNDGTGHFDYIGTQGLAAARTSSNYKEMAAATLADLDGDGLLDLYVVMFNRANTNGDMLLPSLDELYKGDGAGGFTAATLPEQVNPMTREHGSYKTAPRRGYGLCPADFDDDGDLDLFVNNYGAGRPAMDSPPEYWEWNFLWRNDGFFSPLANANAALQPSAVHELRFTDVGVDAKVHASERGIGGVQQETPVVMGTKTYPGPIGGNGFGCSWGDFDNDGDLDLVVGQIAHPDYSQSDRLMLHVNPGGAPGSARVFGEESAERGLEYYEDELHPVLVDVNNDGRLDLVVSRLRGGSKWEVYLQNAEKRFVRQGYDISGVDITQPGPTVWSDFDGDGDLDFFMPKGATGRIFENVTARDAGEGNHFLTLQLVAEAPRDATGARVTLESSAGIQVREVIGGSGHYNAQQTRKVHFGLARDSGATKVVIRWPNGERQELGDVRANLELKVVQGGAITIVE